MVVVVVVVLLVCFCLVDCRRCVVCCTLTFTPDVETSFGYLQEVMLTPVVCPRLFEILTTLKFAAHHRNHIVSRAFETVEKNTETGTARCQHQQCIMNCQEDNRSWKGSASVLVLMRWLLRGEKRCYVDDRSKNLKMKWVSVIVHKITQQGIFLHDGFHSCRKPFLQEKRKRPMNE